MRYDIYLYVVSLSSWASVGKYSCTSFELYYVQANLCWRHCLLFSSLAYDLTHRSRGGIYELNAKVERADKVGQFVQFSALCEQYWKKYQPPKLRNCCVAKKLISHTFSVKFLVFRREFLPNHSLYWAQIFRDNWNCYALSIFRVFILLASSDSDKHMLMRQKR